MFSSLKQFLIILKLMSSYPRLLIIFSEKNASFMSSILKEFVGMVVPTFYKNGLNEFGIFLVNSGTMSAKKYYTCLLLSL